jgi:diguanylate cyclase (GGDEF)-like protein
MQIATPNDFTIELLRVGIADQGLGAAASSLRHRLSGTKRVELVPGDVLAAGGWNETYADLSPSDPSNVDLARHAPPEVVIVTWSGASELGTVLTAVRRKTPDAAIVVVIPQYHESLLRSAIRLGAEDCVTASELDTAALMRVLLLAAERNRLTTSLRAAAFSDELTGLYNRRGYVTRASSLLKVADPKMVWQIFFDVDDLKMINDTYGHWAGDRALMEVAAVLRQAFRSTDIVARVGGDEFAVLAVAPADAAPESWTARWREPLAALASRSDMPLSVSVGLAQPDVNGRMTPDDLLTRADTTMYIAKRLRKGRISGEVKKPISTPPASSPAP